MKSGVNYRYYYYYWTEHKLRWLEEVKTNNQMKRIWVAKTLENNNKRDISRETWNRV